jgi:hypothetical protein
MVIWLHALSQNINGSGSMEEKAVDPMMVRKKRVRKGLEPRKTFKGMLPVNYFLQKSPHLKFSVLLKIAPITWNQTFSI